MKYRKKPVVVEAVQWFKHGDHSGVELHPEADENEICIYCGKVMSVHGWIWAESLEGGYIVCPCDWIITGSKGRFYPCKPDKFNLIYEPIVELIVQPN